MAFENEMNVCEFTPVPRPARITGVSAFTRTIVARVRELIAGLRQGESPMQSADDECSSRCAY